MTDNNTGTSESSPKDTTVPPVHDLIYDPTNLTIRSSIPNIPDLAAALDPNPQAWSRIECINIHHQLMSTYIDTRARPLEVERTCKTSRGWWVVWVRISPSPSSPSTETATATEPQEQKQDDDPTQEAFLIRKSTDHPINTSTNHNSSTKNRTHTRGLSLNTTGSAAVSFFRDLGGAPMASSSTGSSSGAAAEDTAPGRLVEGLGIDARRYIERLMSLNR